MSADATYRTPDERFAALPGFDHEPIYEQIDGLRMARVESGEGAPVLFLHGEPTWSYLWRDVIGPVAEAGHRCICPDLIGFGRSDKPTDVGWYSFERHFRFVEALVERLDLTDATVVVHDWGGPIGLRLAAEHPERISRIVAMDTGLFTGEQAMSDAWFQFRNFVERTEDLPISLLVRNATARGIDDEVAAAFDAPFPNPESKAGARAFPLILPTAPDAPGAAEGRATRDALRDDDRPKLAIWADSDPIIPFEVGERFAASLGAEGPVKIERASHFLQLDAGEEIGRRVADWLGRSG
ncbi:alpha/beta fold hydrolase [Thermoleophilia bacterium SCSIO 60948]|nr:alpha/beta fold hydrolase [Thermoleophilia bacterium SCSIO 60948]